MDGAAAASSLGVVLQILVLDLLLSGDNALVIALACRRLPEQQARQAAWMGAAGAILLRVALTTVAGWLMELPFVQLVSALPLLVIALNLMSGDEEEAELAGSGEGQATILAAVGVIIVSDAAMSIDNVVALAAVSGGDFWLLVFGLVVSIPLIVFGSFGFSRLMRAFPWLADAGATLLGWVAGGMVAGDPLFANWIGTQAPALTFVLPLAFAIFVFVQGRLARENAEREAPAILRASAPPPVAAPRPKPKPNVEPGPKIKPEPKPEPKTASVPLVAQAEPLPADDICEETETVSDDRWMLLGLVALFAIFGVFLLVFILIPD